MNAPLQYMDYIRFLKNVNPGQLAQRRQGSSGGMLVDLGMRSFNRAMAASFVLDYTSARYLYVAERMGSLVDFPLNRFLRGGLEFMLSICHPDDLKIFNENIFPVIRKFFGGHPGACSSDYLISFNYRVRTRSSTFIHILQQSVITDMMAGNMPLMTAGFLTDISAWVTDSRIIHTIEPTYPASGSSNRPSLKNVWFPRHEDQLLTARETEILKLVCEGFDSRRISDRLSISWHTVNNHRRSILKKTRAENLPALVAYASRTGLI